MMHSETAFYPARCIVLWLTAIALVMAAAAAPCAAEPPVSVDGFSPASGWAAAPNDPKSGTLVTISGAGFSPIPAENTVLFSGKTGYPSAAAKATVEAALPKGSAFALAGQFGRPGAALGELDAPNDIAIDEASGDIYVADLMNRRVMVFDKAGKPLRTLGSGLLNVPRAVAVGKTRVYIAEEMHSQLGAVIVGLPKAGGGSPEYWGAGKLSVPTDIALDINGDLHVLDAGSKRYLKFLVQTGQQVFSLPGPINSPFQRPTGIAFLKAGSVAVIIDPKSRTVYRYNMFGLVNDTWGFPSISYPNLNFAPDTAVAVDWEGQVYFESAVGINKLTSDGTLVGTVMPRQILGGQGHMRTMLPASKVVLAVDTGVCQCVKRIEPTDTEKLLVRVPTDAKTGPIRVQRATPSPQADESVAAFRVLDGTATAAVSVTTVEASQGVPSYPFVAGKETLVWVAVSGIFGHPTLDAADLSVTPPGPGATDFKVALDEAEIFRTATKNQTVLHFHVPPWKVHKPGTYTFALSVTRDGKALPVPQWSNSRTFVDTGGIGLVLGKFTKVPQAQWQQQDPFPWFDMKTFLHGINAFERMYPVSDQSVVPYVAAGRYVSFLADGAQEADTELPMRKEVQLLLNQFFNTTTVGGSTIRAVGLVDNALNKTTTAAGTTIMGKAYTDQLAFTFFNAMQGLPSTWGALLAHEIGHTFDLVDPKQANHSGVKNDRHSGNSTLAGEDGAPIRAWNPMTDIVWQGNKVYSVMAQGVSNQDDRAFFESMVNGQKVDYPILCSDLAVSSCSPAADAPAEPRPGRKLVVSGAVDTASGVVEIDGSFVTDTSAAVTPPAEDASERAVFLDDAGTVLAEHPFGLSRAVPEYEGDTAAAETFALVLPVPEETARIELRVEGRVGAVIERSARAPVVEDVQARALEGDRAEITWTGSDADGDRLQYAVHVAAAEGAFVPLAAGLSAPPFVWDRGLSPGGPGMRIKIVASDGFHQGSNTTPAIDVPDNGPRAAILAPADGATVLEGQSVFLRGAAFDPETGRLPGDALTWHLDDEDDPLGSGHSMRILWRPTPTPAGPVDLPLGVGRHTITLLATDPDGRQARHAVTIEVLADTDRDGSPDALETACGSDARNGESLCPTLEYAAKALCGQSSDGALAPGTYFTTVNVHNPSVHTLSIDSKIALAAPEGQPGSVSEFVSRSLGPDEALRIDCPEIERRAALPTGAGGEIGFVVIRSPLPLDVVTVHSVADASDHVTSIETERVSERPPHKCPDLAVLDIETPRWDDAAQQTVVRTTVRNVGSSSSAPGVLRLEDEMMQTPSGAAVSATTAIPALAPTQEVGLAVTLPYWVYNQPLRLKMVADPADAVAECDEANNIRRFSDEG